MVTKILSTLKIIILISLLSSNLYVYIFASIVLFINLLYEVKLMADKFAQPHIATEYDDLINNIINEIDAINTDLHTDKINAINKVFKNYDIAMEFIDINETSQRLVFNYKLGYKYVGDKKKFTKVADVNGVSNELKLALHEDVEISAKNNKVGISIKRNEFKQILFKDMINNKHYKRYVSEHSNGLPFILGLDENDNPVYTDLVQGPHLLIAGETGSGKSNALHVLLTSLLLNKKPKDLQLVLSDFKLVELSTFTNSSYLAMPIAYNLGEFEEQLNYLENEMIRRNKLMLQSKTRDITSYNDKYSDNKLPFILFVIEELSAIMLSDDKKKKSELENKLARLAAQSRSAGIHIIITTQKPISDVLTGVIKSNIPKRLALKVNSNIDSQLILDKSGAEDLLGNGDALLGDKRLQIALLESEVQEELLWQQQ